MGSILTMVQEVVTAVISIVGNVVAAIVAQPLLMIPVGIGLLGSGVALFRKIRG